MTDDPQTEIPPKDAETAVVLLPVVEECATLYRTGSDSYSKDSTSIVKIVDRRGTSLEGVWEIEWTEISPGIETRRPPDGERRDDQRTFDQALRIHPSACPVNVLFRRSSEVVYFDEPGDCFSRDFWRRYEKVRILQWIGGIGGFSRRIFRRPG